jgi:hypothetical protein
MSNQVVDQHSATADAQRIAYEIYQLWRIKVVRKQIAADKVEGSVPEGECKSIGDYGLRPGRQMRGSAVKQSKIECDASSRQAPRRCPWSFSKSSRDLQQRQVLGPSFRHYPFHHRVGSSHATEPTIYQAEVLQRGLNVAGRASIGIEKFGSIGPLHEAPDMQESSTSLNYTGTTIRSASLAQTSANSSSSNCLLYRSV